MGTVRIFFVCLLEVTPLPCSENCPPTHYERGQSMTAPRSCKPTLVALVNWIGVRCLTWGGLSYGPLWELRLLWESNSSPYLLATWPKLLRGSHCLVWVPRGRKRRSEQEKESTVTIVPIIPRLFLTSVNVVSLIQIEKNVPSSKLKIFRPYNPTVSYIIYAIYEIYIPKGKPCIFAKYEWDKRRKCNAPQWKDECINYATNGSLGGS